MNNILVIGSGVMGNGIAELLSIYGMKTTITDTSVKSLNQSKRKILFSLNSLVNKSKITNRQKILHLKILILKKKLIKR